MCGGNNYLLPTERKKLATLEPSSVDYKKIIEKSDERIDKYYEIYSYNKFIKICNEGTMSLRNSLLIIDEIQNMVSEKGSFYSGLNDQIDKSSKDLRIVLLSATPMFDKPTEIALTLNLLRLPKDIPTGRDFEKMFIKESIKNEVVKYSTQNMDIFKKMIMKGMEKCPTYGSLNFIIEQTY